MGVHIGVFLSHDLADPSNAAETLNRLAACLPSALAVSEFWKSRGEGTRHAQCWKVEPEGIPFQEYEAAGLPYLARYEGPGNLALDVTSEMAELCTGARWRGFLTIEELRVVHLAAFRAVARALGSAELIICADSNGVAGERFLENGTQAERAAALLQTFGPPQPSVDQISAEVAVQAEHGSPKVWFLDRLNV